MSGVSSEVKPLNPCIGLENPSRGAYSINIWICAIFLSSSIIGGGLEKIICLDIHMPILPYRFAGGRRY